MWSWNFWTNVGAVVQCMYLNTIIDSCKCGGRLGHVNYDTLRRLSNLDFIPKFEIDNNHKCETCVESKMTRPPFNSVDRITEPLVIYMI